MRYTNVNSVTVFDSSWHLTWSCSKHEKFGWSVSLRNESSLYSERATMRYKSPLTPCIHSAKPLPHIITLWYCHTSLLRWRWCRNRSSCMRVKRSRFGWLLPSCQHTSRFDSIRVHFNSVASRTLLLTPRFSLPFTSFAHATLPRPSTPVDVGLESIRPIDHHHSRRRRWSVTHTQIVHAVRSPSALQCRILLAVSVANRFDPARVD
jgi:hypothetical protein